MDIVLAHANAAVANRTATQAIDAMLAAMMEAATMEAATIAAMIAAMIAKKKITMKIA